MTGMVLSVPWQVPSAGPQKRKQERRRQGGKSVPFLQQGLEDGFTPILLDGLICSNCAYYIIQLQRLKEQLFIILSLCIINCTWYLISVIFVHFYFHKCNVNFLMAVGNGQLIFIRWINGQGSQWSYRRRQVSDLLLCAQCEVRICER